MITQQSINERYQAAQYCDDYTQYKREMREIAHLQARLRPTVKQARHRPGYDQKGRPLRSWGDVERDRQVLISQALDKMDNLFRAGG